ncbi:Integrin alpha-11 [Labeo rohita]|uniref:Integrin alpha-11 n=1 Tax=Labeo rohita TaxID=84645 RepID=A0ABQ8L1F2_LABRO|nr:Integrin alpha-11 [Labeo rohita]
MDQDEESCSTSKPSCDAQTQRSDPVMEDHSYSRGPTIICRMRTTPPQELSCPVADIILKRIPLLEFHTLGFTVRDLLEGRRVKIIPAFTRKACQLTKEVTYTRRIAHCHIHAE